jgi:hypothetical protein
MAIIPDSLFGEAVAQPGALRAFPREDGIIRGTLGQFLAAADLPHLTPLYFKDADDDYAVWLGQSNEVNTLTAHATTPATAGSFTLTVNGVTSAAIAYNATAAIIQAALEAMSNIAPGDVVAVATTGANLSVANAVVTLNWGGAFAGQDVVITADQTLITAGSDFVLATSTAGGSDASDGSDIDAFLWSPEGDVAVSTTGQLIVNVMVRGLLHRDDIPVPSGESQADLDEALLGSSLREKGFDIQGLPNFH